MWRKEGERRRKKGYVPPFFNHVLIHMHIFYSYGYIRNTKAADLKSDESTGLKFDGPTDKCIALKGLDNIPRRSCRDFIKIHYYSLCIPSILNYKIF
jgi:hypothetical protein